MTNIQQVKLTGGSTTVRTVCLVLAPFTCGLSLLVWIGYEIVRAAGNHAK